ncbi:SDR family oxidoreductase [Commensalibacter oyaizuii]|uniref:SDR family oxidoreductase n=1 Tax=Commensalibacter oyaizuii TaxID=3043873 RepID=A0ABT6Q2N6_9PROT|nr:SDR family oxidoreductase [Commensalibacter sp. TBRC 16381]MDI2091248.1 SDR family oxidoreductase [Commensalibacter sp. TBRC 16381]
MKICVLGGTGFIGSHIVSTCIANGHNVTIGCRDTHRAQQIFPNTRVVRILADDPDPTAMADALHDCDAVINTIGVIGKPGTPIAHHAHIQLIHTLVQACQQTNKRIVHISALSLEENIDNEYCSTKMDGENILRHSNLETIILRASFIYSSGSYGGSSALRGLCAMPFAVILPNGGQQKFQPIWAYDLAEIALKACNYTIANGERSQTVTIGGPETLSFAEIVQKTRLWMGMKAAKIFSIPLPIIKIMGKIGDHFPLWGFSTGVVNQMTTDFVTSTPNSLGIKMKSMDEALQTHPAFVQDRWHAKLFLLRPFLALILAAIWLGSAISGFLAKADGITHILPSYLTASSLMSFLIPVGSLVDFCFAVMILFGKWSKNLWFAQIAVVLVYTLGLTIFAPSLWLDLYGALLKNLSVITLVIILFCITDDR